MCSLVVLRGRGSHSESLRIDVYYEIGDTGVSFANGYFSRSRKLQNIQAKPQDPRDLLVALSAPGSVGTAKYFYFFLVSSFRDHSRISLRYDTVPVYGSISNESFRFNQIMPCPGPCGGRNDISFHFACHPRRQRWRRRGREINVGTNSRSAKRLRVGRTQSPRNLRPERPHSGWGLDLRQLHLSRGSPSDTCGNTYRRRNLCRSRGPTARFHLLFDLQSVQKRQQASAASVLPSRALGGRNRKPRQGCVPPRTAWGRRNRPRRVRGFLEPGRARIRPPLCSAVS
jgi:hypothetical protein